MHVELMTANGVVSVRGVEELERHGNEELEVKLENGDSDLYSPGTRVCLVEQ